MRTLQLWGLTVACAACAPGETSIVISYPSAEAKIATKRMAIYAFPQDSAARSRCRDYVTKLPSGEQLGANPVDDPFALDGEKQLTNFPAGDPVVMVVGLNDEDPTRQKPILQGCTDTYGGDDGYSDVPVTLEVVVPSRTAMTKVAGDHVVGALGGIVELRVRVDTAFDMATQRVRYPLPAVPVTFEVKDGNGVTLGDTSGPGPLDVLTDHDGEAAVKVHLPGTAGTFTIAAVSEVIRLACQSVGNNMASACRTPSETQFVVSAVGTDELRLRGGNVVQVPAFRRAVGVGVGDVTGSGAADVVVLGCDGTDRGCLPGRCAGFPARCKADGSCDYDDPSCPQPTAASTREALGSSKLLVVSDISGTPSVVTPRGDLGVTPGGLFVGPLVPGGQDDIAVVNSRRASCQDRQCEGSEMLVFSGGMGEPALSSRQTMTGSNAVSIAGVRRPGEAVYNLLLTAAQGRATVGRACNRAPCLYDRNYSCPNTTLSREDCLDKCNNPQTRDADCVDDCLAHPENCGCPPRERCECISPDGCPNTSQPGACVAQDKFVDRLTNEYVSATPEDGFSNEGGCQQPVMECTRNGDGVEATCTCLDRGLRGNLCNGDDGCGCKIPQQVSIGDLAGVVANDLAVGRLQSLQVADMVAASEGGIDFFPHSTDDYGFNWSLRKTPMSVLHFVRTAKLNADEIDDIVWAAKAPCEEFANASSCPLVRAAVDGRIDGAAPAGCMGLYIRKANAQIETTTDDGCRRYLLPIRPAGICTGDVNADTKTDVIVSGFGASRVLVYLGDNNGGLLDPPVSVDLPSGGAGGLLACADVDGDRVTDVVALGRTGVVSVLQTSP